MGTSPMYENGVSVASDETTRGGQREAGLARRGLRERIELQRPIRPYLDCTLFFGV